MLLGIERLLKNCQADVLATAFLLAVLTAATADAGTITLTPEGTLPSVPCEAHVAQEHGPEQVAPCGQPMHTTGSRAFGWIETPTAISLWLTDVTRGGNFTAGRLVPGGLIALAPGPEMQAGEYVRLISLDDPIGDSVLHARFEREITARRQVAHVPAGPVVALLIDPRGRAVAASRPIRVGAGRQELVWPALPGKGGTVLVATLLRPRSAESSQQDRITLAAVDSRGSHDPDGFVNGANSVFAVWYGLSGATARIAVGSHELRLAHDGVTLAAGTVTLAQEKLDVLPRLTVVISASDVRRLDEPLTLTVAPADEEAKVLHRVSAEAGKHYTFADVPASIISVDLHVGGSVISRTVDLTSGQDTTVEFRLEPIVVSGIVYLGDMPAKAQVRFRLSGTPVVADTDDNGSYSVTLWQQARYVLETTVAARPGAPPLSQNVIISASRTLDIHVPQNSLSARVYDTETGKPIQGARISVSNRWVDEAGTHSFVTTVVTNGEVTHLPPQRAGTTEVAAYANGYSASTTVSVPVDDTLREKVLDFPLTKAAGGGDVRLQLEDGSPAASAEVATWAPVTGQITWTGSTDDDGRLPLPEGVAGQRLLIRHPTSASQVVLFAPGAPVVISLHSSAPPVVVTVVHRDQSRIGTTAAMATVWLGAVRLTGAAAAFATWSPGATSGDGTWIGRGLPAEPVRVMFTRNLSVQQISSGSLDAMATTILYPWPAVISVTLANE